MRLSEFDYVLPEELIAQVPCQKRDQSRLMVLERHKDHSPSHRGFGEILDFLQAGDLLVMNDTRVIPARIFATKETGGRVELLFLQRQSQTGSRGERWEVMTRSSRPIRAGMSLSLPNGAKIRVIERLEGGISLFEMQEGIEVLAMLEEHGALPLPPYIDPKQGAKLHADRYQTVFAKVPGAVAAPTAGLHFTPELLESLQAKGVELAWVTLHVGLGTFLPVRCDQIEGHQMHSEVYEISEKTAASCHSVKARGGRIIAVGTTSLRALEASAQRHGRPEAERTETDIFIYPGFSFRAVDGLLTNFHLPKSTLLMLVAAFHGKERILQAYREAVDQEYRFFSYGDAMLLLP